MKLFALFTSALLATYIIYTEAIIPKPCMAIATECISWAPLVKHYLIEECCTKCGEPIPYADAKPHVDRATIKLADSIIPYIRTKVPKFPKDITTKWIASVAKSIEESFSHHTNLCLFDLSNPKHMEEVGQCKQKAIAKALPRAIGMMPLALTECPKGKGIATHIMHDIPEGTAKCPPINITHLMEVECGELCKKLKAKKGKK